MGSRGQKYFPLVGDANPLSRDPAVMPASATPFESACIEGPDGATHCPPMRGISGRQGTHGGAPNRFVPELTGICARMGQEPMRGIADPADAETESSAVKEGLPAAP